ncbi:DNA glycosylase [Hanseniaspora valbyensis NRRL Y-1626]|uniref:DNA glycosylase n=1 Tax=Hanseniaspora valbyensis NRRL Y-1626 TaxID=766949 RepID=A0A1B7TI69_9ASCO|nr:DNA glycosylase [Hanseniaspora valbyensis NRRL Y-1626]
MTFQAFENLFKDSMHYNAMEGVSFKYLMTKTEPEIDSLISKVGFHKRKAKAIKDLSLLQNDGDIPLDYDSLISLNGVGPKIAMLTLQNALGEVNGIGVDTHVNRFASKFEWIENSKSGRKPLKNAEITRKLLQKDEEDGGGLSKKLWAEFNLLLVGFGQEICTSTKLPKCNICLVKNCKDRRIEIDPSLNIIKDIEDLDIGVDIKNNHVEEWLNFCKEKYNLVARDKDEDILGDWDVKFSNLNKEIHGVPLLIKEENKEEKESFKRIKIDVKIEDEEMNVITKRTIKQEYL